MNALIAATFAILAVSASAAPSGHGLIWGGVNPHALSPVGPSGIVTGYGASGPSGTVTGAGAAGPSGIVTGAGPIGPTGPAGHGLVAAHAAPLAASWGAAPWGAAPWAAAAPLTGLGHGAWGGLGGHGLALGGHGW
ncbi:collagen alpha-1(I) chain-like [Anoplophora glabripennis]|uniref:collagen alpha-1(I) chain-like n=1 Tax=Anoplophora glabripennis TaxID=217634 RepID=UPI000874C014|nr:collagen alpha-1(I) chain-like [Anoplophora glabripennis]